MFYLTFTAFGNKNESQIYCTHIASKRHKTDTTEHLTITPTNGDNLKECKKHDGHNGSVMVHQLENVDPHLNRDTLFRPAGTSDQSSYTLIRIW